MSDICERAPEANRDRRCDCGRIQKRANPSIHILITDRRDIQGKPGTTYNDLNSSSRRQDGLGDHGDHEPL